MTASPTGPAEYILRQLDQLRFKNLFLIVAALLLVDLAIPDVIPLLDEILLGILTMLFWSWRRPERDARVIDAHDPDGR